MTVVRRRVKGYVQPTARQVARRDHPDTSHAAARRVEPLLTHKMFCVIYAHYELEACTEGEAFTFLVKQDIPIGHPDNVRKRRGEVMSLTRGFVDEPLIERADPDEWGKGPALFGPKTDETCYRFTLTRAGLVLARSIDPDELRRLELWDRRGLRRTS